MYEKRGFRLVKSLNKNLRKITGSRKAQESLMWTVIFELLLAGMSFAVLMLLVIQLGNNDLLFKQYYAGDIAVTAAVIYSAPGNLRYDYQIDEKSAKKFYFQMKDSMIFVADAKGESPQDKLAGGS